VKKLIVAVAFVGLSAGVTFAADVAPRLYTKAPPLRSYDWTGFYAGVNVGGGVGQSLTTQATPSAPAVATSSYLNATGLIAGGQMGYNWQWSSLVLGVEADIQGSGMESDATCSLLCLATSGRFSQQIDWFGTVRGRAGLATGPVLSYITGGLAYGDVTTSVVTVNGVTNSANFSETRTGWTFGSGVEASLGGNWTGKLEYLYLDLGRQSGTYVTGALTSVVTSEVQAHIFRAGLNYRFGGNSNYVEPLARWNGMYAGINFGSGIGVNKTNVLLTPVTANEHYNLSPEGLIGGGQIGYNWQTANWVYGIETDFQASSQKDDRNCQLACFSTGTQNLRIDQRLPWLGTTRGRLGYSLGATLFYSTAGVAYGQVENRTFDSLGAASATNKFQQTLTGWTVGGGVESPFDLFGLLGKNWTATTEYLYVDLGNATTSYSFGGFNHTITSAVTEHIFRMGVNYHFNQVVR
jgi:outer membrane immunogenic protein